jgi:pyrimidine/purine-5'-nucleotide nucleosidase
MSRKLPYATVRPSLTLDLLSQREMASLANADEAVHQLFRRCALAILNADEHTDDPRQLYAEYADFSLNLLREPRGLKLELFNAPSQAFVDGKMIRSIRHHLFTALRDIVFVNHKLVEEKRFDLETSDGLTDTVFRILRNAAVVGSKVQPRLVVCWGGHSIARVEYEYCKDVGYQLGLRGFDIATGCGPGAMKAPMKGAAIAHAKQLATDHRYVGISEPGIIAAESPNPIVNELVILPDIEKRLEAFVRLAHGTIIFPGGAGTLEEILYLLGIKMHPDNADHPMPMIMAAPQASADYFIQIDRFLRDTLGDEVARHYRIFTGEPAIVAREIKEAVRAVRRHRLQTQESFSFNWGIHIPHDLQHPFEPTHDNMAALDLHRSREKSALVSDLRKAFSGIVAGNVKEDGVRAVAAKGPYKLDGEPELITSLSTLLNSFMAQGRMKLDSENYTPCFELG